MTKIAVSSSVSLAKRLQLGRGDDFPFNKQLEPVGGLFEFPQRITNLRDEFRYAATAVRFTVIRTNRRSGPENLLAQHLRHRVLRQLSKYPDDA